MSKIWKISSVLVLINGILFPFSTTNAAATNYVTANRTVTPSPLLSNGEAEVTLNITGTPPVNVVKPNDVVLIMDKSGSMQTDNRFKAMIDASKSFVDLIDFTKHQVGVVDFSSTTSTFGLNTDPNSVKNYIDSIAMGGSTNTGEAINQAINLLSNHRTDAQPVIVLLTDGQANSYDEAKQAAQAAKDAGIVFYTIALLGPNEDPLTSAPNLLLGEMATTQQHHHFVLGSVGLADVYKAIVQEIGLASAYDVEITETVSPQFEIVPGSYNSSIPQPTVTGNTLKWNIQELKNNTLQLKYKIRLKQGQQVGTYSVANYSTITYKDYAGSNRAYTIENSNLQVKHPAPIVTSIDPTKGKAQGGETVTIKGDFFRPGVKVLFGSNEGTNVNVLDQNTITVTTPPGNQGNVDVTVKNDDNQSAKINFAYFADPEFTSITVNKGPFLGENSTIIYGKYFMPGIKVMFGSNKAEVNYINSTQLNIKVPAATVEGLTSISLENPDGTHLTLNDAYTYDPPIKTDVQLDSISPAEGPLSGGTIVTLTGKNIDQNVKVYVGTQLIPLNMYYSKIGARIIMPASTIAGSVDITLENPDGTRSTLTNAFTYIAPPPAKAPVITSISQIEGYLIGGDIIYVNGENFVSGITAKLGNVNAQVLNFYNDKQIRIKVPTGAQLGSVDLTLTNPDAQSGSLANAYTYIEPPKPPAPTITAITPNNGTKIGGDIINIDGTNFVNGLTVKFNGVDAKILNYYSATKIRIQVPASSIIGAVDVTLTNPDGQSVTLSQGYTYTVAQPTITSLTPNNGALAGGELIYLNGTNFFSGLTVTVGGKNAPVVNFYSSSSIRIQIPAGTSAGTVPVVLTNPDGTTATTSYTYNAPPAIPAPTITNLTLSTGTIITSQQVQGGTIIYLNGKDMVSGVKVDVGGTIVTPLNFYNSTSIRFRVPYSLPAGTTNIKIINPDNQISNVVAINYIP
ncbi:IPT/TIG domain-containing protein [Gottfriedia solisilvae]|uniref:IPT/TIG domain-containing protein n=1 Tax=Gottfriedia solisilvae TaxID=1516104 RepID=UPI000B43ADA4|nr:IPT/TIG domain-containing protein [Gottfriedia solisilvae]